MKKRTSSSLDRRAFLQTSAAGLVAASALSNTVRGADKPIAFAIHGGAGTILKSTMTPEKEADYRAKLTEAVTAGHEVLKKGGKALDAVVAAIVILEDSPLFNAGKGAVFTADGTNELDSSIMDGSNLAAGAVAGVKRIQNPILLARMVMEKSPHVMMIGTGAETFAKKMGMPFVPPEYFRTEHRWRDLQKAKAEEAKKKTAQRVVNPDEKYGTVGAVALDSAGNLAAGTSTGGMTNKKFNRVGDAPIIGAGTYANNASCAVSATGYGEYFIRSVVGHDISALIEYKGLPVAEAAETVLGKVAKLGGDGGVIVMDRQGRIALAHNTPGMYRASIDVDGKLYIGIYKD